MAAPRILHPLLLLVARATDKELVRQLEYLRAENRILRAKLPQRITVTPAERAKLVKLGRRVGAAIKHLISIVHPRTFARWVQADAKSKPAKARKPGRPRRPDELRALILQMAKENAWGKGRICGELKKLGITVSRSTIRRILIENGFDPAPKRRDGAWFEFVERQFKTLWACDFFRTKVWTPRGVVEYFVLFFMHIETRRVHIAGLTPNPDAAWMAQQARNLCMFFDEQGPAKPTYIIRDHDSIFTAQFCSIIESDGIKFVQIPPLSPNMNPHAERWVQTVRRECLDHFLVFGERHLRYLLTHFLAHYHRFRPHQGIGNELITKADKPPEAVAVLSPADVICHESLGGLLKHYERRAA